MLEIAQLAPVIGVPTYLKVKCTFVLIACLCCGWCDGKQFVAPSGTFCETAKRSIKANVNISTGCEPRVTVVADRGS